jgi:erythromycin esterase-like protein
MHHAVWPRGRQALGRAVRRGRHTIGLLVVGLPLGCGAELRHALRHAPEIPVEELRRSIVPLAELDASGWAADDRARILAIGEPTHGTLDPRRLHSEIIVALARASGAPFVVFGEWCDVEGRELDAYVGGRSTLEQPPDVAGPVVWSGTWAAMWTTLRREHAGTGQVVVYGMRACGPQHHEQRLAELIEGVDGDDAREPTAMLAQARTGADSPADAATRVEAWLATAPLTAEVARHAVYQVRLWHQSMRRSDDPGYSSDRAMAQNVIYVLDVLEPRRRAVILAHNGHVARTELQLLPNGYRREIEPLGVLLDARFGHEYRVLVILVGNGDYCAVPTLRPRGKRTRKYRLRHPEGALERKLAVVGSRPWRLEPSTLADGSMPAVAFIGGQGYYGGWPFSWFRRLDYRETDPTDDFDVLVYFPTARPDVLPGCHD